MDKYAVKMALKELSELQSPQVVLQKVCKMFIGEEIVFTTSFGVEDQVITDMIFSGNLPIKVVAIDTGRLFEETYRVQQATIDKYGKQIQIYYPNTRKIEGLVSKKGPFSFYESIENRKECCYIRKVEPLQRILQNDSCWITGLRSEQSAGRTEMSLWEYDDAYGLYKINPLISWKLKDVENYLHENNVPYNSLHHKGFASIGCAPCTRAIKQGEDFRAGRWWWEQNSGKECGLHAHSE